MTKYIVEQGTEIFFQDSSVAIKPVNGNDNRGPEAFLERVDGTGLNPELIQGHTKVLNSKRGFRGLKNIGWWTLEVEVPAPPMASPKLHK